MFEILNIPPPPLPGGALGMLVGAMAILTGVLLLTLGRVVVWRLAAAACLGGLGLPIAAYLAERTEYPPFWLTVGATVVMAAVGLATARLCWAVYLGAAAALGAMGCVLYNILPAEIADAPAGWVGEDLSLGLWAQMAGKTLGQWLQWMLNRAPLATIAAGGAAGVAGLTAGLFKPVAARIVATSVTGSALCVAGLCVAVCSVKSDVDFCSGRRLCVLLIVGGLAAVVGIVYQARGHKRSRGDGQTSEAKTDEADDEKE